MDTKMISTLTENTFQSRPEIIDFMKDNGFKHIGSGCHADCYSNENIDFVIKVFEKDNDINIKNK